MIIAFSKNATATSRSSDPRMFQTVGMVGAALALRQRSLLQSLAAPLDGLKKQNLPRCYGTVVRQLSAHAGRWR